MSQYSREVHEVLNHAQKAKDKSKHSELGSLHILSGLLQFLKKNFWAAQGIDLRKFKKAVNQSLKKLPTLVDAKIDAIILIIVRQLLFGEIQLLPQPFYWHPFIVIVIKI